MLGTSNLSSHYVSVSLQAELSKKDRQTADLQENIKTQQSEASKAKEELTRTLGAMEKLKEGFNKERADWETEKSALIKRAENAEAALKPVVDELTGGPFGQSEFYTWKFPIGQGC